MIINHNWAVRRDCVGFFRSWTCRRYALYSTIILLIILLCCSTRADATYVKLVSYCNTSKGEGTCVSTEHCCRAMGGEILTAVPMRYDQPTTTTTSTQPPLPISSSPYLTAYADLSSLDAYMLRNMQDADSSNNNGNDYYGIPLTGLRPQFGRALYDVASVNTNNNSLPTPAKAVSSTGTTAGLCSYSQLCCVIPPRIQSEGCQICGRRGGGADKYQPGPGAAAPTMPTLPATAAFPIYTAPKHAYVVERMSPRLAARRAQQRLMAASQQHTLRSVRSVHSRWKKFSKKHHLSKADGLKGRGQSLASPTKQKFNNDVKPLPPMHERIVNGRAAVRNAYCWQVALLTQNGMFGSGTLIARNWVVTTAHKIAGRFLDDFIVALGEYDFKMDGSDNSSANVFYSAPLQVLLHPDYDPQTYENDIALVRIPDAPCQYDNICTVCLPNEPIVLSTPPVATTNAPATSTTITTTTTTTTTTSRPGYYNHDADELFKTPFDPYPAIYEALRRSREKQAAEEASASTSAVDDENEEALLNAYLNTTCVMSGWGETLTAEVAPSLQESPVNIVSNAFCRREFDSMDVTGVNIPETMFCGSGRATNSGSCDNDGGGPLVCQRKDRSWALVGIIALGLDWCRDRVRAPTMFVNVGLYRQWIVSQLYEPLPAPVVESLSGRPYTAISLLSARKSPTAAHVYNLKYGSIGKRPVQFKTGNYESIRWQNPLYV